MRSKGQGQTRQTRLLQRGEPPKTKKKGWTRKKMKKSTSRNENKLLPLDVPSKNFM
jgi:hypothetical protein